MTDNNSFSPVVDVNTLHDVLETEKQEYNAIVRAQDANGRTVAFNPHKMPVEVQKAVKANVNNMIETVATPDVTSFDPAFKSFIDVVRNKGSQTMQEASGQDSPLLRARVIMKEAKIKQVEASDHLIELKNNLEDIDGQLSGNALTKAIKVFVPTNKLKEKAENLVTNKQEVINEIQNIALKKRTQIIESGAYLDAELANMKNNLEKLSAEAYWLFEMRNGLIETIKNGVAENEELTAQEFDAKYNRMLAETTTRYNDISSLILSQVQSMLLLGVGSESIENTARELERASTIGITTIRNNEMVESVLGMQQDGLMVASAINDYASQGMARSAKKTRDVIAQTKKLQSESTVNIEDIRKGVSEALQAVREVRTDYGKILEQQESNARAIEASFEQLNKEVSETANLLESPVRNERTAIR